jgi:hypothetical protein
LNDHEVGDRPLLDSSSSTVPWMRSGDRSRTALVADLVDVAVEVDGRREELGDDDPPATSTTTSSAIAPQLRRRGGGSVAVVVV